VKYAALFVVAITGTAVAEKPRAPVTLTLTSTADGAAFDVRLVATATRDVPSLSLALGDRLAEFGATRAGQARTLSVRIAVPAGEGSDVLAIARAGGRSAVRELRVGAARKSAPKHEVTHTLPNGRRVVEAR
jgi:hypothetical protein